MRGGGLLVAPGVGARSVPLASDCACCSIQQRPTMQPSPTSPCSLLRLPACQADGACARGPPRRHCQAAGGAGRDAGGLGGVGMLPDCDECLCISFHLHAMPRSHTGLAWPRTQSACRAAPASAPAAQLKGVCTNLEFLREIAADPRYAAGGCCCCHTGFATGFSTGGIGQCTGLLGGFPAPPDHQRAH